jgi:streptogramin lyase
VWVAIRGAAPDSSATVLRYDPSGRVMASVPVTAGVTAITLAPDSLWVAEYRRPLLMRIDRRTGRPRSGARLIVAAGSLAYGGGHVWAAIPNNDTVVRVDPRRPGSPVFADAGRRPEHLAYARGRLYVASRFDQTLVVIDPLTMKPARRPLPMPFNPFAVTADGAHVWVTGLSEDTVTRVDLG